MRGIIQIVMAIKPLEGNFAENGMKHGVAGLNIDGCRIGTGSDKASGGGSGNSAIWNKESDHPRVKRPEGGRWAANLILGHSEGCKRVGVKRVKGNPHLGQKNPDLVKQYGGGSFGGGQVTPGGGYAGKDGKEEVEAWECVEGCSIKEMDKQSGIKATGTWCRQKDGAHPFGNAIGSEYTQWKEVEEDEGGASRYYKQVSEYDKEA